MMHFYLKKVTKYVFALFLPTRYKKWFFKRYNLAFNEKFLEGIKFEKELYLLKFLLLSDNAVFFDIGANIGEYMYVASKYIKSENLYAFEPLKNLHIQLKQVFKIQKIYNFALSDSNSIKEFKIPIILNQKVFSRATLDLNFREIGEEKSEIIKIETKTLDDFVEENHILYIDLIKIDVEGHEYEIIKGGLKTLKTLKPIMIIEIDYKHHNNDINDIINKINLIGYSCYYFDLEHRKLREVIFDANVLQTKLRPNQKPEYNFIFFPKNDSLIELVNKINYQIK